MPIDPSYPIFRNSDVHCIEENMGVLLFMCDLNLHFYRCSVSHRHDPVCTLTDICSPQDRPGKQSQGSGISNAALSALACGGLKRAAIISLQASHD